LDAKGRTLVSVQYALEGTIEKRIKFTRITPVQIPQHANVGLPKQITIATKSTPTENPMPARKDFIDKPIELLLQSVYSCNKGLRWRRKQLGLVASDIQDERFRQPPEQLLVAQGILTSNKVVVTDNCTQANQHRKRGNDGQWANRIQRSNPHTIAYLCNVAWDVSINLPRNLQRRSYGIVTKTMPKSTTGVGY
jgi:hypothetical protein